MGLCTVWKFVNCFIRSATLCCQLPMSMMSMIYKIFHYPPLQVRYAVVQVVSRRPVTAKAWFLFQACSCAILCGRSDTERHFCFPLSLLFHPYPMLRLRNYVYYITSRVLCHFSKTRCWGLLVILPSVFKIKHLYSPHSLSLFVTNDHKLLNLIHRNF
jgi:hypothetical protein